MDVIDSKAVERNVKTIDSMIEGKTGEPILILKQWDHISCGHGPGTSDLTDWWSIESITALGILTGGVLEQTERGWILPVSRYAYFHGDGAILRDQNKDEKHKIILGMPDLENFGRVLTKDGRWDTFSQHRESSVRLYLGGKIDEYFILGHIREMYAIEPAAFGMYTGNFFELMDYVKGRKLLSDQKKKQFADRRYITALRMLGLAPCGIFAEIEKDMIRIEKRKLKGEILSLLSKRMVDNSGEIELKLAGLLPRVNELGLVSEIGIISPVPGYNIDFPAVAAALAEKYQLP